MNKNIKVKSNSISGAEGAADVSAPTLNVFNIKIKKDDMSKTELSNSLALYKNFVGKPKHFPPANKEWFNSVYSYNKNTTKLLPTADHVILKLIKSYFNLYSRNLEKKIKSRRMRMRTRRLSTNRILVSRPEVKHTSDKVVITIYVYNRQKIYLLNKIKRIASIDEIDNLLREKLKRGLAKFNKPKLFNKRRLSNRRKLSNRRNFSNRRVRYNRRMFPVHMPSRKRMPSILKIKLLRKKSIKVRSKVRKHKNMLLKMLSVKYDNANVTANKFKHYEIKYLKGYVKKSLRREIFSTYFKQLLFFNKSKFDERYLLPLTKLSKRIYSKKIEFNLVDLKYLYLNSYIFSNTIVTKLKNRNNKLYRVLKASLLMFKLPVMNRIAVYDEIYNRKRKPENIRVIDVNSHLLALQSYSTEHSSYSDKLELLLSKADSHKSLSKLKDYNSHSSQGLTFSNYPLYLTNTILNFIKHKYVSGIRLEVAGRLTRRNTAARSVFKLKYKGNIQNMHSSYKGLPSVLLRGYAKSNLQYTNLKSKRRIGSFGVKGWISSS